MNLSLDARIVADRPLSVECDLKEWVNRETALAAIDHFPRLNGGIALCLTVYNETAEALHASFVGLADSIRFLRETCPGIAVSVCMLVDGLTKCSSSTRAVLDRFAGPDFFSSGGSQDLACLHTQFDLSDLSVFEAAGCESAPDRDGPQIDTRGLRGFERGAHRPGDPTTAVQLLIAVKQENHGKLDSHWWFYRIFCPHLNPAYCFQMDVGTMPTEQALQAMTTAFQGDPCLGAVASSIMPPPPSGPADLLHCWQYVSFANSTLLDWPAENTVGYLSVVPGQLSAIRWEAISGRAIDGAQEEGWDPLAVYFKGLEALTPYESMLYAAEDRVLCREIVSDPQVAWTISHIDRAMAVTDPCNSWGELLRQRKRWSNGYMACRVNFIKKLPGFIANPTVSMHRKIRSATAGIYHSVMLVNDWLVTAVSILLLQALTGHASSLVSRFAWASGGLRASFWAAMCALLVQFFICYRGSLSARSLAFFRFSIALQGSVFAVSLCVALLFGRTSELIPTTAFIVAALPLASLLGHRRQTRALLTSVPIVAITGYFVTPLMWMYAVCNAHDSSWGTKGLTSAPADGRREGAGAKVGNVPFRRFRTGYVSIWIVINLCFVYVFDTWFGSDRLGAVIALQLMNAVVMLFGLICRASTRLLTGTGTDDHQRERRAVAAPSGTARTVGDSRVQPS
ncbi:hypothetical protein [Massilia rhizosphaerae]|uniref:hypothetical protein n=1 Tax=Massilia rhizosphaerae TaxID=2784389 RepID=UPI0018DE1A6A|nr:hypothetical protein [Massilia rhizosphaerae]